ncbi:MAG: alkylation response protein AidB-like acyl-CoA dehydrogenase [Planctomycetota bacterium]|jgi:alkylation response protein AidB-like acyl-CoA dehydrogenase
MRMVPMENVELLKETGYTRGLLPRRFGGSKEDFLEFSHCSRKIAAACPSTGWVMHLLSAHAHAVAAFDEKVQEEIWGKDADTFVCSSVAPTGTFTRTDEGYRVSGRYRFSSGCDHAQWALLGGYCENEAGDKEHLLALLPALDYQIIDTWHAAGLKGTGSKDLQVDDVLVPEYRAESFYALATGQSRGVGVHDSDLYRIPFMAVFGAGFSTIVLGIADGMLRNYTDYLKKRTRAFTGAKMLQSIPACMRLAESSHELNAASLILENDWADFVSHGVQTKAPTEDTQVKWRTNQAYAVKLAVQAADRLYEASGGSAAMESHAAQRYWRDIHVASAHAYTDYDVAAQILGRHLAGLPPDPELL